MFEFSGSLSYEIIAKVKKQQRKGEITVISIVTLVFSIPLIIIAIDVTPIVLLFLIIFALMYIPSFIPPTKSFIEYMPVNILLDLEDGTIVYKNKTIEMFHMISDIKNIEDNTDFYRVIFSVGDKNPYYILQKDLIVQGTIQEFEEYFNDIIVKKVE